MCIPFFRAIAPALFLLLGSSFPCFSQDYLGTYTAEFKTEEGTPFEGVSVRFYGNGYAQEAISDNHGRAYFSNLHPGFYTLKSTFPGFDPVVFHSIRVESGSSLCQLVTMKAGIIGCVYGKFDIFRPVSRVENRTNISKVELQKLPQSRDPWGILETIPGIQVDRVSVAGNASHQRGAFSGFGDDGSNTTWTLDGIDFSDHVSEGLPFAFLDFGALSEVSVVTGALDVSSGSSGTVVNFVTKQGTNEHSGSLRLLFTNDNLQSGTSEDGTQPILKENFEKGIEIGGPLIKDRFWYWGAFQQSALEDASGESEIDNLSLKLHGNLTPTTRASAFYYQSENQLKGVATLSRAPETAWVQERDVPFFKVDLDQRIGQSTALKLIYARVDGGFNLSPAVSPDVAQPVFNELSGRWENSYRDLSFSRPNRVYQLKGETYLTIGKGAHEFDYGFEYKKAWAFERETWGSEGTNLWVDDYSGLGRVSYFRAHRDKVVGSELESTSLWLKDSMQFGGFTLEIGARYNRSDTNSLAVSIAPNPVFPEAMPGLEYAGYDPQFKYETLAPQLGLSYRFGKKDQFLVRGSYRKYYDPISTNVAVHSNPFGRAWITGYAQDFNGDGAYEPGELGFALDADGNVIPYLGNEATQDPYSLRFVGIGGNSINGPVVNSIDPNLEQPEADEYRVGWEWELHDQLRLSASYTLRERSNTHWMRTHKVFGGFIEADDYELAHTLTGIHPDTGEPWDIDYYVLSEEAWRLSLADGRQHLTNRPDYSETHESLIFEFERPITYRRWMVRGSLAFQDWTRDVGSRAVIDPTPDQLGTNVDSSVVVNRSIGEGATQNLFPGTARWSGSLQWLFKLPWEVDLGGTLNAREGYVSPPFISTSGFVNGASRTENKPLSIGPNDAVRNEDLYTVNLRLGKEMQMGSFSLDLALEVFNLLNEGTVLQRNRNYGTHRNNRQSIQSFEDVGLVRSSYQTNLETLAPRTFRLSAAVSF